MATYAIGDIQGCFEPFMQILQVIQFDAAHDTLWITGDLVNRGPASLAVLRYLYQAGDRHQIVLGNHDLHLLAVSIGARAHHHSDTMNDILHASDKTELLDWLRHRPMLVHDAKLGYVMTHAGLAPCWTVEKAQELAHEVESVLRGEHWQAFLPDMYGNQPDLWQDNLTGNDRLRCIINYFTRMRFCDHSGRLNLTYKGKIDAAAANYIPWFDVTPRLNADINIVFGHWAALEGKTDAPNLFALDTGCVWGNQLSALRLEDGTRFSVPCPVSVQR